MPALSPEARYQIRKAERILAHRDARQADLLVSAAAAARLLREQYGATRVWVFGSVLQPWFHETSDLDLAAEGLQPERAGEAWDRVADLAGCRVDLVLWEEAGERLRARIESSGRVLP